MFQLLLKIIQTLRLIILLTHKYSKNIHTLRNSVVFHNTETQLQGFEKVKP